MPDTKDPHPQLTGLLAAEPDLVDRIFEYLLKVAPGLAETAGDLDSAKVAVREEFGSQRVWVRAARGEVERQRARRILELFNGRNTREVARTLGVSRSTVLRALKQPGRK